MKDKKIYHLAEFLFTIIIFLTTFIIFKIFKNSFFLFQFGFGIISITTGYIGMIISFLNQETGRKLEALSCFMLILFCIIYSIIQPELKSVFILLAFIISIIFWMLKTIIKKRTLIKMSNDLFSNGKYLKLSSWLAIVIIINVLLIIGISIYPFERNLNLFEGPNGSGLNSYVSETADPKISVNIDGGFIFNITNNSLLIHNKEALKANNLIGALDVRFHRPTASIDIIPFSSGTLIVNLYNYSNDSEITINGEKVNALLDEDNLEYRNMKGSTNKIIGNLIANSYLNNINNYYLLLNVESDKEYNINIKPIVEKNNSWIFYAVSDLHSGINISVPVFKKILDDKPNFIIADGDIVNNGGESEYIVTSELFNSYPVPIYTAVGNHDVWSSGAKYYSSFFGPSNYSFVYRNATFIIMNTSSGIVGQSQFEWLESELKKVSTDLIFVVAHIPPVSTITGKFDSNLNISPEFNASIQNKAESDKLLSLCEQYHVNYFIAGHLHAYNSKDINGTTYISSGVLGGLAINSKNIGYLKFKVADNNISVTFDNQSHYYSSGILKQLQAAQIFLIPALRSGGIRLLIILTLLITDYGIWLTFKHKLLYHLHEK